MIIIDSMTLDDLTLSGGAGANKYGEVKLNIKFEKISKIIKGNKTLIKSFPVRVELDSSNKLIKCYSALENAVLTAKIGACGQIGGVYDGATGSCDLASFSALNPLSESVSVSTQSQTDFFNHMQTNVLEPNYVNVAGDTMTGKLQVNAKIESNAEICVDGKCRTFNEAPCPSGQVVRKINQDGTVVCSNVTCPNPSTFFVGVNASGTPICKAFPTNTCSANQYVSKVNADGSVECSNLPPSTNKDCTPGAIQRIDAAGNQYCVAIPDLQSQFCPNGFYLRGFNYDRSLNCRKLPTHVDTNTYGKFCERTPFTHNESYLKGFTSEGEPICRQVRWGVKKYLTETCKICIACSYAGGWNEMVVCDKFDDDGWVSSAGSNYCAKPGRLAIKVVCNDNHLGNVPNSSP